MTRPAGSDELIVHVGPSLPAAEVERLAPAAQLRPPIAVGELLALTQARRRPGCVLILDGYFERMAAVWHKEILVALERGIAVWGASSMGALRAAELGPWGMVGVGAVYRAFARGELSADDEVAVAHLPAAHGFAPISDALVNLRHGLAGAQRAGAIGEAVRGALVELARARPYRERTWAQLLEDATTHGTSPRAVARLRGYLARHRPDAKAADARLALRRLTRHGWSRPAPIKVPRTWALLQLAALSGR
ncbi:MAG: tfuA protein [Myxococcales bacterium]|nr:tfuA protein [Myxococcales bacterium]